MFSVAWRLPANPVRLPPQRGGVSYRKVMEAPQADYHDLDLGLDLNQVHFAAKPL